MLTGFQSITHPPNRSSPCDVNIWIETGNTSDMLTLKNAINAPDVCIVESTEATLH